MSRDLFAPSHREVLQTLSCGSTDPTLLAVAQRLWPELSIEELCQGLYRFPGASMSAAPCIYLRETLRPLVWVGQVLLTPCPGGVHCHDTGRHLCPLMIVGRCPWPPAAVGPVWAKVVLAAVPGRPRLSLEVVEPAHGEGVAVGRVLSAHRPIGTVLILGEGDRIELRYTALPGQDLAAPSWPELRALERLLSDRLVSQIPRWTLPAQRLAPASPCPTIGRCVDA